MTSALRLCEFVIVLVVLLTDLSSADAHALQDIGGFVRPVRRQRRQCNDVGQNCFNSAQCCTGFVCVAFDDNSGFNPEIPGVCAREKDLPMCTSSADCPLVDSRCLQLGRNPQRYCIDVPLSLQRTATIPRYTRKQQGGLGSMCTASSDCSQLTSDGLSALCCQEVKMARQGKRRMCDRYRPNVSVCL